MIEIVSNNISDDRGSRTSRTRLKSSTSTASKINEFKDWRGRISQPNLLEYIHIYMTKFCFLQISISLLTVFEINLGDKIQHLPYLHHVLVQLQVIFQNRELIHRACLLMILGEKKLLLVRIFKV